MRNSRVAAIISEVDLEDEGTEGVEEVVDVEEEVAGGVARDRRELTITTWSFIARRLVNGQKFAQLEQNIHERS